MKINKLYLYSTLLLMVVLPTISTLVDFFSFNPTSLGIWPLIGKWFTFWGIGLRLLTAGIRQVIKPAFTAREIFHIASEDAQIIVKELGYANICMGAAAFISLFMPGWRTAAAFTGGLYMGIAGINHVIKKPASPNEVLAMVTDLFIAAVLAGYLTLG